MDVEKVPGTRAMIELVRAAMRGEVDAARGLFDPARPVRLARAPGRLDVMGGIADYSGSLVLQWPIREATFAVAQASVAEGLRIVSLGATGADADRALEVPAADLQGLLQGDYAAARAYFADDPARHWAAYVAGVVLVLARERGLHQLPGLAVLVRSEVPEAKGVSSSAALEVAAMQSVAAVLGVEHVHGTDLARFCQLAENYVVGAPCGIMDQMASALGQQDHLLSLLCQPAEVRGYLRLPSSIAFWGIDSGIRHAVTGSDYTSVRAGAFMGYRMIAAKAGLPMSPAPDGDGRVLQVDDPRWGGFVANLSVAEFDREFAADLPETIAGAEFLAHYSGTTDPVTRVEPGRTYAVRQPTAHPICEHDRVRRFGEWLVSDPDEHALMRMGELMVGSHRSYSACGLGSDGTDQLVEMVLEAGPKAGLYGAKITGGGSGGTVAILGRADAGAEVEAIARRYAAESGREPYVFAGSSPGAMRFGTIEVGREGVGAVEKRGA